MIDGVAQHVYQRVGDESATPLSISVSPPSNVQPDPLAGTQTDVTRNARQALEYAAQLDEPQLERHTLELVDRLSQTECQRLSGATDIVGAALVFERLQEVLQLVAQREHLPGLSDQRVDPARRHAQELALEWSSGGLSSPAARLLNACRCVRSRVCFRAVSSRARARAAVAALRSAQHRRPKTARRVLDRCKKILVLGIGRGRTDGRDDAPQHLVRRGIAAVLRETFRGGTERLALLTQHVLECALDRSVGRRQPKSRAPCSGTLSASSNAGGAPPESVGRASSSRMTSSASKSTSSGRSRRVALGRAAAPPSPWHGQAPG